MALSNALGRKLLAEQAAKGRKASTKTPKQQAQALVNKAKRKSKSKLREQCPNGKIYAQALGLNTPVSPGPLTTSQFFIPFNVVSKKNSKQSQVSPINGKTRVISSEAYLDYAKLSSDFWAANAIPFRNMVSGLPFPLLISFRFVRPTKGRFDFGNMCQGPLDLMQEHSWIPGDHSDVILPYPEKHIVSPQCAGVIITVLKEVQLIPL